MHLVTKAKYAGNYKIEIVFDDGKKGIVDLKDFIFCDKRTVFERLRDAKQFRNFLLDNQTIVWGDDLDLAPEFLHDLLIEQNSTK